MPLSPRWRRYLRTYGCILFEVFSKDNPQAAKEGSFVVEQSLGVVLRASGADLCGAERAGGAGALLESAERAVSL